MSIKKTIKRKTVHGKLVDFFSDTCLATRGFRPKFSVADMGRLKRALSEDIFDQSHWEQVILYFLADRNFKNLSPSLATMLSATILNGLRNAALNREKFYKEIDEYTQRYITMPSARFETKTDPRGGTYAQVVRPKIGMVSMADKLKAMQERMSATGKGVQG